MTKHTNTSDFEPDEGFNIEDDDSTAYKMKYKITEKKLIKAEQTLNDIFDLFVENYHGSTDRLSLLLPELNKYFGSKFCHYCGEQLKYDSSDESWYCFDCDIGYS